jgi:hypothetical protein
MPSSTRGKRHLWPLLGGAILLVAGSVAAQDEAARAESLFRDGKRLLVEKRYDEACPRFAESARLDPSSGVELALGFCYESEGKLASAWGAYAHAATLAHRDARADREAAATQKVALLETQVARVTFVVPAGVAALPGLQLRQDGVELARVSWTKSPIDPGTHKVEVTATGYQPFTSTFTVAANGARMEVPVPALRPVVAVVAPPAAAGPVAAPAAVAASGTSGRTVAGLAIAGVGVAGVVVGGVFGAMTLSKASSQKSDCASPTSCTSYAQAAAAHSSGTTDGAISTAGFIAGGALLAGGVVLLLTGRSTEARPSAMVVSPSVGPGMEGVLWSGTF